MNKTLFQVNLIFAAGNISKKGSFGKPQSLAFPPPKWGGGGEEFNECTVPYSQLHIFLLFINKTELEIE